MSEIFDAIIHFLWNLKKKKNSTKTFSFCLIKVPDKTFELNQFERTIHITYDHQFSKYFIVKVRNFKSVMTQDERVREWVFIERK
jgi:hypothetical protein